MKMQWRLRVLMAEREIGTATELHRRLKAVGVEISSAQLTRIIKEMPARISTEVLRGLLIVLECGPEDLFLVEWEDDASPRKARPPVPRKGDASTVTRLNEDKKERRGKKEPAGEAGIAGPRAIPFPVSLDKDKD